MESTDASKERFINVLSDLITKYADKIDLDGLPDVKLPEAEMNKSASFFIEFFRYFLTKKAVQK